MYIAAAYGELTGKFDGTLIISNALSSSFLQVSSMGSPG